MFVVWAGVVLMTAAALCCVLLPLFRYRGGMGRLSPVMLAAQRMVAPASDRDLALERIELERRRDGLYAALRDLHYDFETGRLQEAEYAVARQDFIRRAAAVLARLDALQAYGAAPGRDDEIERAVSKMRRVEDRGRD
jgi:NaMN:DMB phosphoribosyltransferase